MKGMTGEWQDWKDQEWKIGLDQSSEGLIGSERKGWEDQRMGR
jgi:hypothetical protein